MAVVQAQPSWNVGAQCAVRRTVRRRAPLSEMCCRGEASPFGSWECEHCIYRTRSSVPPRLRECIRDRPCLCVRNTRADPPRGRVPRGVGPSTTGTIRPMSLNPMTAARRPRSAPGLIRLSFPRRLCCFGGRDRRSRNTGCRSGAKAQKDRGTARVRTREYGAHLGGRTPGTQRCRWASCTRIRKSATFPGQE